MLLVLTYRYRKAPRRLLPRMVDVMRIFRRKQKQIKNLQ